MVLRRDIERTLRLLHVHIDKLQAWGYLAGVLYSTRQGVIKTYGSPVITGIMRGHMSEIHDAIMISSHVKSKTVRQGLVDHQNGQNEGGNSADAKTTFLPVLETRLEYNTFLENRSLASLCVRLSADLTRSRVRWGSPEHKPVWWPTHIPWKKRGVQVGVTNENLKEIITACYDHFGQSLYDNEQEVFTDDVDIKSVVCSESQEELMLSDGQFELESTMSSEVPKSADVEAIQAYNNSLFLPLLKTHMENNTFAENRRIAVNCVKISMGIIGQRVGWGHSANKPIWWPSHVPWTKRGVQLGVTNEDLKDVITACYEHHRQPMYSEDYSLNTSTDGYVWLAEETTQPENICTKVEPSNWTQETCEIEETSGNQVPVVIKEEPVEYLEEEVPYDCAEDLKQEETEHIEDFTDINSNTVDYQPLLPILPNKLDDMLFIENRNIAQICVKLSLGINSRRIGWGHTASRPVWWPVHVPWTKRGVQMGVTNDHLKDIIKACYHFHGQPLYVKEEDLQAEATLQSKICENGQEISVDGDFPVPNCFSAFSNSMETDEVYFRDNNDVHKTMEKNSPVCNLTMVSETQTGQTPLYTVSRRSLHKNRTMPKKYCPGKTIR